MSSVAHPPPLDHAMAGDRGAALLELIARCRRRARLLLFVRYATVGCAFALLTASALLYVYPATAVSVLWSTTAACVGIGCSAAAAFWRAPSPVAVAAALDRRLHLDDSVVAALQVQASTALLAPLIVRHALARTEGVKPEDVFPMDVRRPAATIGAGVVVLFIIALWTGPSTTSSRPAAARVLSGDTSAVDASAHAQETRASDDAQSVTPTDATGGSRVAVEAAAAVSSALARRAPTSSAASAQAPAPASPDAGSAAERTVSASASLPGEQTSEQTPRLDRTTSAKAGAARGDASGSASGHDRDTSGGRGSGGSGVGQGSGSGGVRGGALIGAAGINGPAARAVAANTPQSLQGRRGGNAVIPSDNVPPDLRAYVRRYFLAVRSASERE